MNIKIQKHKTGFTLVELMVAMGIFVILMSIATGGFINALKNQRLAMALMILNDNMSVSIEQMSREIRTGYNFIKLDNGIHFTNAQNKFVWYRLNNGAIERCVENIIILRNCNEQNYRKITADDIKVMAFNIEICGKNLDSDITLDPCGNSDISFPPRITLSFTITSTELGIEKLNILNNIQTTISSRVI